jgi:C1A family cysteine protease
MSQEPTLADLKAENDLLKQKLQEYQSGAWGSASAPTPNEQLKQKNQEYESLKEDLMAKRVFEKTKQLLVIYLSVGGLALLICGIIGIMQVVDFAKSHAETTIKKQVDETAKAKIEKETEAQLKDFKAAMDKSKETMDRTAADYRTLAEQHLNEQKQIVKKNNDELMTILENARTQGKKTAVGSTSSVGPNVIALPNTLDYTSEMNPVRSVGSEGSVLGFAMADAMEYQIRKHLGKKVLISPRFIYNGAREIGHRTDDAGAFFEDGLQLLRRTGAVTEEIWPYRAGEYRAKPPADIEKAEHYKITDSILLKNTAEIKAALRRYGPVVIGIPVYDPAWSTSSGIISMPTSKDSPGGGHAVCVVGFDDGKKTLKFKNSWGADWGDKGYGYLPYEYIDKYLSEAWALSMEPTKP